MIRFLALLAFASPAMAFDMDYAQVFATHSDAITRTGETTRQLVLSNNIRLIETTLSDGSVRYAGFDDSAEGAAGCAFAILVEASVLARACDGLIDGTGLSVLAKNLTIAAIFVGENAVPPVPDADLGDRLSALIDARAAVFEKSGMVCPNADGGDRGAAALVRHVAGPGSASFLRTFETPRLPVLHPCF